MYASESQLERMRRHGYCMNLPDLLGELGADVVLHEPWPVNVNPLNAAELIVVDIEPAAPSGENKGAAHSDLELVAPSSLAELETVDTGLYSRHDGLYFPTVGGFPILTRRSAVIATQLLDDV